MKILVSLSTIYMGKNWNSGISNILNSHKERTESVKTALFIGVIPHTQI